MSQKSLDGTLCQVPKIAHDRDSTTFVSKFLGLLYAQRKGCVRDINNVGVRRTSFMLAEYITPIVSIAYLE